LLVAAGAGRGRVRVRLLDEPDATVLDVAPHVAVGTGFAGQLVPVDRERGGDHRQLPVAGRRDVERVHPLPRQRAVRRLDLAERLLGPRAATVAAGPDHGDDVRGVTGHGADGVERVAAGGEAGGEPAVALD